MRVSPDFKSRSIVATGIRFPVAIRLNSAGDLFCTDQEGATWLPNGNPLDELLCIERGRHYGFPPRHPRHLPRVIDEPSVFDYAPQHQSTCGLNFNEPVVKNGPTFGPEWWRGDALVAGYSRGKLYRTKLVKSAAGYVAQNQLIGAVAMLPADVCVSPAGDMLVAAHSGGPDWGSGPGGKGQLFKISASKRATPRPIFAWPQTPRELRIAFDQPVDLASLKDVAERAVVEYGPYVAAGDRFESLRPGYAVVANQQRSGRYDLKVHSLKLSADRRTLILSTGLHGPAALYAVTLAGLGRDAAAAEGEIAQSPQTDLQYDLTGAVVEWRASGGGEAWQGWTPHVDLQVARELTRSSAEHDALWRHSAQPGTLSLRTTLDLRNLLRPEVQPGAKIDYQLPAETASLAVSAATPLSVRYAGQPIAVEKAADGRFTAQFAAPPVADGALQALDVKVETGAVDPAIRLHYFTAEAARPRAFALRRLILPWALRSQEPSPLVDNRDLPELKGGNWLRGREVFFGQTAACGKCHSVTGEGGTIGPDLSNLTQRDYASVLRDVTQPSFAINPDYIAQTLVTDDGRVLTGSVRTRGESLVVGDTEGRETVIARADVVESRPSSISIMPQGIPKQLGEDKLCDLLTFLLTEPPRMPDYGKGTPPPARSREEVAAVLAGAPEPPAKPRSLHVVLVAGPKDHGPGEHDYPAWLATWQRLLGLAEATRVTTANVWPSADDLRTADAIVFYQQGAWTAERARDIDAFLARGGGVSFIHYAVDGGNDAPGFAQRIGLAWRGGSSKFRHGDLDVQMTPPADHLIARNLNKLRLHDESYWNLVGDPKRVRLLATGPEEGADQPLFWTLEPGKGRVFVSIPGHFAWSFDDPLFRVLLLRGIAWTAGEPVDRFNPLVTAGARLQPAPKVTAETTPAGEKTSAPDKAPAAEKETKKEARKSPPPLVTGKQGMVVTVSPAASDIGLAILERGGNAVDSAIATAFALAVTFPEAGNIGGGGFMMVWPGEGKKPVCIDYRETAPAAAGRDTFARETDLHSHKTVGVPGTVRGLALAHRKFGKLPWRELVAPAIDLAEKGFVLDGVVARGINGVAAKETTGAEFRRVYGKADGARWIAGDRLTLPDLGRTLRLIADDGPDSFYKGAIAQQIVADMKAGGGLITAADLAGYQAILREPIHGAYRVYDIYGPPPPSSGGTLIVEMLNVLENFDLKAEPRWSPHNTHLLIETMRRGFCDRARHIGDPAHVHVPDHLTSKEYAAKLVKTIDPDRATPSDKLAPEIQLAEEGESTTHFSIVDRNRMAVANTYTLQDSWGSRIVVRGGGFLLNNEMTDFNWRPGHTDRKGAIGADANLVAPGKRMLSSQSPTLVARDGKLLLVTGSPGGRTIPNTTLCVLLGVLDFGLDARAAVDAPRIHQQWFPERTTFEGAADPQFAPMVEKLRAMGHRIPEKDSVQGDAHTIRVTGDTLEGAADGRRTVGKAAGY
jgi:gamma-glutamyltranspeptidase